MNIQFSYSSGFLNFVFPPSCLVPKTSYAIKFFGPPKCLWSSYHGSRASQFQEPGYTHSEIRVMRGLRGVMGLREVADGADVAARNILLCGLASRPKNGYFMLRLTVSVYPHT